MRAWIAMASLGTEVLAVGVIVGSVSFGSVRVLLHLSRQSADPYRAVFYVQSGRVKLRVVSKSGKRNSGGDSAAG